jgi:hypothetical protein
VTTTGSSAAHISIAPASAQETITTLDNLFIGPTYSSLEWAAPTSIAERKVFVRLQDSEYQWRIGPSYVRLRAKQ